MRFKRGTSRPAADRAIEALGGRVAARIGAFVVVQPGQGQHPDQAVDRLRRHPLVATADLNARRRAFATPDDPLYKAQVHYADMARLPEAWDSGQGAGVVIAVVDTGVDLDHPDLVGRLVPGWDFVDDDAAPDDENGHGTTVAGVAAATSGNGIGIAGVAGRASLMPVRVLDADAEGFDDDVAAGIRWAVDHGADVINLSLGGSTDSAILRDAVAYAAAAGAVVVVAAGNYYQNVPQYPAAYPQALSVTGTDWSGNTAWWSVWNDQVDVAAPGWRVTSTYRTAEGEAAYATASGTSLSAAVASGVVALVREANPAWSAEQVRSRVATTARDAGPQGIDPYYGHGVLDARAALTGLRRPPVQSPRGDTYEPNDDPSRAKPLAAAQHEEIRSRLSPQGDADWWYVDVATTGLLSVHVDIQGVDFESEATAVAVEGFDPELRRLGWFFPGPGRAATSAPLDIDAARPGRYYFRVTNRTGSRTLDTYRIQWSLIEGAAGRWRQAYRYPLREPGSTAIADVTGDGRDDVLVTIAADASEHPHYLLVFEQDEEHELTEWPVELPRAYPLDVPWYGSVASYPTDVTPADLDGDGDTDVAIATQSGLRIYKQVAGELVPAASPSTTRAQQVEVADMDADGRPDLVTRARCCWDDDGAGVKGVWWLRNLGTSFAPPRQLSAELLSDLELADVDGNGRVDVVGLAAPAPNYSGDVVLLRQSSAGAFTRQVLDLGGHQSHGLAAGDLTGDGRADIAVSLWTDTESLAVLRQRVDGTFDPLVRYFTGTHDKYGGHTEIADMDGDGRLDVVFARSWYAAIDVHYQLPDGTLGRREVAGIPTLSEIEPTMLAVGDVDGDGRRDVSVAASDRGLIVTKQRSPDRPLNAWVTGHSPPDFGRGVSTNVVPSVTFGRPLDAASITATTVQLVDATSGQAVGATRTYSATTRRVTITPSAPLATGRSYIVRVTGVRDTSGRTMRAYSPRDPAFVTRFTVGTVGDTTAPETVIADGPARVDPSGQYWLPVASEPGVTYECFEQGMRGSYVPCAEPLYLASWEQQTRSYFVRAVDGAGNVDPTPASRTWDASAGSVPVNDYFTDRTPITGNSGTLTATNDRAYRFHYEPRIGGNDGGATVWWSWTPTATGMATFETAGSGFDTLLGVGVGTVEHQLTLLADNDDVSTSDRTSRVRLPVVAGTTYWIAVDGWSPWRNKVTGDIVLRWSVAADTAAPTVAVVSPPAGAAVRMGATFSATASDDGGIAGVEFRLGGTLIGKDDTAPYAATWTAPALPDGQTTLSVRATDRAGNVATATRDVVLDNTAPTVAITAAPPAYSSSTSATFQFTSNDAGASFRCGLDGAALTPCTSPRTLSGLSAGRHTFRVQSVDPAGNAPPAVAASWSVDLTAPVAAAPGVTIRNGATIGSAIPVALSWSGTDVGSGVSGYQLAESIDGRAYRTVLTSTARTATRPATNGHRYRWRVRARDRAGTWGSWSYSPVIPARVAQESHTSVRYSSGWTAESRPSASGGSLRYATARAATARITFTGRTIAWVTTRAAHRGVADVYVDGKLAATVDLRAATTSWRRVAFVRTWTSRSTHTVVIKLRGTSGRPRVDVDAFAVLG